MFTPSCQVIKVYTEALLASVTYTINIVSMTDFYFKAVSLAELPGTGKARRMKISRTGKGIRSL